MGTGGGEGDWSWDDRHRTSVCPADELWAADCEVHGQISSGGSWGSMAPGWSLSWIIAETATWKLTPHPNRYAEREPSSVRADPQ